MEKIEISGGVAIDCERNGAGDRCSNSIEECQLLCYALVFCSHYSIQTSYFQLHLSQVTFIHKRQGNFTLKLFEICTSINIKSSDCFINSAIILPRASKQLLSA